MPPLCRKRHVEVDEEYDEFEDDADNMSDDEDAEELAEDEPENQRDEEMLDDDAVFGLFKKHVCAPNSFYLMSSALFYMSIEFLILLSL